MGDCSDPADHLVWERWQFVALRIQGGMFVRASGEGCRQDECVPVRRPRDSGLRDLRPVVGGGAVGWRKTSTPPCHRPPRIERRDGAHGRTRTAGLLLTKEVLVDQFLDGPRLRSNPAAIANNRCLAALPRKSPRRSEMNAWLFLHRWYRCVHPATENQPTAPRHPGRHAHSGRSWIGFVLLHLDGAVGLMPAS